MAAKRTVPRREAVAIVGMSCVYPGALSPEELWQNVLAGRRYFRKFPDERLPRADYWDADPRTPGKSYCDQMAVIEGWRFDPLAYRIPPVTVKVSDMAHWLALDTARRAFEDAGVDIAGAERERMGVVLGNSLTGEFARSHYLRFRWPYVERAVRRALAGSDAGQITNVLEAVKQQYNGPLPEITEDSLAGNMSNTIAGRICNYFDLGGGGYTIDGACSSSLLSVAQACTALVDGDLDMALAGGVDISLDPFEIIGFAKTQALAAEDIRPYDAEAAGMLAGEGCGLFVLMRESEARKQKRKVLAVIRGWGYSTDGAGGITAPEVEGQARALRNAYRRAGYEMGTVGLVEGHGTGTALGDKVEISAILKVLGTRGRTVTRIGSIKGAIGHCKAAAGAAGLVKAVMALGRKMVPPTANCGTPNPAFGDPPGRLVPCIDGGAWEAGATPRRASVSSMGFGGSNAHVTLEEADPKGASRAEDMELLRSARQTELLVFSAQDVAGMRAQIERAAAVAARMCRADLTDMAAELARRAVAKECRLALVVETPWQAAEILNDVLAKLGRNMPLDTLDDPRGGVYAGTGVTGAHFVALFPGQGSQRLNMGKRLARAYPCAEEVHAGAERATKGVLTGGLCARVFRDTLTADNDTRKKWSEVLDETRVAQPAIVASSMAAYAVLEWFGLAPSACIGHSLGEISALGAAGAFDATTAVRIAALRGKTMATAIKGDTGGMTAVMGDAKVAGALAEAAGVSICNHNSPRQTVVGGTVAALAAFETACAAKSIRFKRLGVSHAFHTAIVAPAADAFGAVLGKIGIGSLRTTVISSMTGAALGKDADLRALLGSHIQRPVRFIEAVRAAAASAPAFWCECGPGTVLSGLVRDILTDERPECYTTDAAAGEDACDQIHHLLARAFASGMPVKTERLFAHRFSRSFSIEAYAPELITNPCERAVAGTAVAAPAVTVAAAPVTGRREEPASDKSALEFAVEWISQRTGFPKTSVLPDMKLRDDLNLDSIKVGELVYVLSKQLKKEVPADPSAFANARLTKLLSTIQNDFKDVDAAARATSYGVAGTADAGHIGEWVRTFQVERTSAPLGDEAFLRMPTSGAVVIVGDPSCWRVNAITARMEQQGLSPVVATARQLADDVVKVENVAVLIVVLPEAQASFLECSPEQFDEQAEGTAAHLFTVFRWAERAFDPTWANVRSVVVRPQTADGHDDDLDAGKAFVKTLRLEHAALHAKWLTIPAEWTPDQWATIVEKELQTSGSRVFYAYDEQGNRYAEIARPPALDTAGALALDARDVVFATGGAKGITFELARALAKKAGVALALTGTSPAPKEGEDTELGRNLRMLKEDGIRSVYIQCDVTDLDGIRRAVMHAEDALGAVTVVLHGAGISDLRLLRDLDPERFLRTIRVKVRGLYNLLAAIRPTRLKALHVLSSVLGKTGMKGQTDYTLANAWLDGAVQRVRDTHPRVHCLSVGYSVWTEVGLGVKLGAVKSLAAAGVTSIDTQTGVQSYLDLLDGAAATTTFIVTGRLGEELEAGIFPAPPHGRPRFLQRVLRYTPCTEIVAEATLTHATDLYLLEHVYEGTPVFPGVMALEAMAEAAGTCVGRGDLCRFEAVEFIRPVIVPDGATVAVRVLALAEPGGNGTVRVRTAIRTDADSFHENHAEAVCVFGTEAMPAFVPPPVGAALAIDPGDLYPTPLFQGKFFRRIETVRQMDTMKESVSEIVLPDAPRYYAKERSQATMAPYPAARDAFLQTGLLILPHGSLPVRFGVVRIHQAARPGVHVFCHARVDEERAGGETVSTIAVFDANGGLVETIEDIVTRVPQSRPHASAAVAAPVPLGRMAGELSALFARTPHGVACVPHASADAPDIQSDLLPEEAEALARTTSPARRAAACAGVVAARRAAMACADRLGKPLSSPACVSLHHRADGKPEIHCASTALTGGADTPAGRVCRHSNLDVARGAAAFCVRKIKQIVATITHTTPQDDEVARHCFYAALRGMDISLTDGAGITLALVGPQPVGVDIEPVAPRSAELWRALLGDDGYALALRLVRETGEAFDCTAVRVWSLLEAAKKANSLRRILPEFAGSTGGTWLAFSHAGSSVEQEYLSALVRMDDGSRAAVCVSCAADVTDTERVARTHASPKPFETILAEFDAQMQEFAPEFANDPRSPDTEAHHRLFLGAIDEATKALVALERTTDTAALYTMRQKLVTQFMRYLDTSDVFRHAIEKPLGYAGDFLMLDKLVNGISASSGLAYHFDRSQLEYPASVACRNRVVWVCDDIKAMVGDREIDRVTILDIGIGAAPIERRLKREMPELGIALRAVDIEPAALEFVKNALDLPGCSVQAARIDLRRDDAGTQLASLARGVDVCIAVGIVEALRDEEMVRMFHTLFTSLPRGTVIYTESFLPNHPSRPHMEWFMDFHLGYRSREAIQALIEEAGARRDRIESSVDATGSLGFLKIIVE